MEWLFGKRKTPEQMMRENQRLLERTMRDLDRERMRLDGQEKKVIMEIKKLAKLGQMDAVRIMAKDLVRTRNYSKKFLLMRTNIQAVSLKVQTLRSTQAMGTAMKGVARTMQKMNAKMNLPELTKIMREFEKQSEVMEMKQEMMDDMVDDALGEEGDEEESDKIVTQVLDELGIEMAGELGNLPATGSSVATGTTAGRQKVAVGAGGPPSSGGAAGGAGTSGGAAGTDTEDLQARLDALRRGDQD